MSEPANKRSDLGLVLFLLVLAAVPRLWSIDSLGLSHFDEGGYANSALAVCDGTAPEAFQPLQHLLPIEAMPGYIASAAPFRFVLQRTGGC